MNTSHTFELTVTQYSLCIWNSHQTVAENHNTGIVRSNNMFGPVSATVMMIKNNRERKDINSLIKIATKFLFSYDLYYVTKCVKMIDGNTGAYISHCYI